jgi:hypothetical protein
MSKREAFFRARDALTRAGMLPLDASSVLSGLRLWAPADLEYVAAHPEHVFGLQFPQGLRKLAGADAWGVWLADSGRVVATDGSDPVSTSEVHSLEAAVCIARTLVEIFREAKEG